MSLSIGGGGNSKNTLSCNDNNELLFNSEKVQISNSYSFNFSNSPGTCYITIIKLSPDLAVLFAVYNTSGATSITQTRTISSEFASRYTISKGFTFTTNSSGSGTISISGTTVTLSGSGSPGAQGYVVLPYNLT